MAACFCTGACKTTGSCNTSKHALFEAVAQTASSPGSQATYQKVGRKWVKIPLAMNPIQPKPELPKKDFNSPRGYRHVGMDHF